MCNVPFLNVFHFFSCYRSNLVGTRFTVFNNGVNPKKGGCMSDGSNIREEVAAIIYVSEVFVGGETTYCNLQQKDLHCVMLYIVAQWSKKSPLFSGILFTLMWSRKPGWKSTVIVAPLFFYHLFWTQAYLDGIGTNGTWVPCEVPSLPNPSARKGWPQHWGLHPLFFSNSGMGSFTSHMSRSVKVL